MKQAIAVVGRKKTGKTALVAALAEALGAQGVQVAAIKCSHSGFDAADTDTARLSRVCTQVAGVSPGHSVLNWSMEVDARTMFSLLSAEMVLVEGGKDLDWLPRIIIPAGEEDVLDLDRGLALAAYYPGEEAVGGVPAATDVEELAFLARHRGFALPGLDCGQCDYETCAAMARAIVGGHAEFADCVSAQPSISIRVGGKRLELNPFVEGILSAGIVGMLSRLKGFSPADTVINLEADHVRDILGSGSG